MPDPTIPELAAWCRREAVREEDAARRHVFLPLAAETLAINARNLRAIATALERAERLEAAAANNAALRHALTLALEYWSHRQQRYKNRHPAWVVAARAALTQPAKETDR